MSHPAGGADGWRHVPQGPTPPGGGAAADRPAMPQPPDAGPAPQATPSRPDAHIVRPMPDAGESFDAIAMKSVLSRARDASRYQAPALEDPSAQVPRRVPWRALLAILVAVAVVGVASGIVYVTFFRQSGVDEATRIDPTESASQDRLETPQEAVQGYFAALASGDIRKALSFGPKGVGATTLLTPAAHEKMPEASRPSQFEVLTEDPHANAVQVRYWLAGKQVETTVRVTRGDTGYSLARTTVTLMLQVVGGDNLPMTINGIPVDSSAPLELVPGTYQLGTGLPYIAYPQAIGTLSSLAYEELTTIPIDPALTDQGRAVFLQRARESLNTCLASRQLAPRGCPNAIAAGRPIKPGSVTWRLRDAGSDPFRSSTATLVAEDKTRATLSLGLTMSASMTYADGSTSGRTRVEHNYTVTASMLGRSPKAVQVTWSRPSG